jgi:5'-nucleotidase
MKGTITGMWLDGVAIDPATTYSVTVNSFLASGGDNFFELGKGTNKKDTGMTDLQAMVDYMGAHGTGEGVPVDDSQRAVGVTFPAGAPTTYRAGDHVRFDLSSLSMTGAAPGVPADPVDTAVQVKLGDAVLGSFPVTTIVSSSPDNSAGSNDDAGTASVDVVLPGGTAAGTVALHVVGATGTDAIVPITVEAEPTLTVGTPTIDDTTPVVGQTLTASPGTWGPAPVDLAYQWLADGAEITGADQATFTVTAAQVGQHLSVRVTGTKTGYQTASATSAATGAVAKLTPTLSVTGSSMSDGRSAVITVQVTASGVTPTGTVTVRQGGTVLGTAVLMGGVARVTIPKKVLQPGNHALTASYSGDASVADGSVSFTFKVVKG